MSPRDDSRMHPAPALAVLIPEQGIIGGSY